MQVGKHGRAVGPMPWRAGHGVDNATEISHKIHSMHVMHSMHYITMCILQGWNRVTRKHTAWLLSNCPLAAEEWRGTQQALSSQTHAIRSNRVMHNLNLLLLAQSMASSACSTCRALGRSAGSSAMQPSTNACGAAVGRPAGTVASGWCKQADATPLSRRGNACCTAPAATAAAVACRPVAFCLMKQKGRHSVAP